MSLGWLRRGGLQAAVLLVALQSALGDIVHIATTACGREAAEEVIPLLKSIALHASPNHSYVIHVFMDNHTEFPFIAGHARRSEFEAAHVDISFHAVKQTNTMDLFKRCSTNRLYAAEQLPGVDAIVYLDADTLAVADVFQLWRHFGEFSKAQELAAAREGMQCPGNWTWWFSTCGGFKGWYPCGEWEDFVAPTAVNAGVLLMNLTRLRTTNATAAWEFILTNRTQLFLGDQDVLNIHYNHTPGGIYILPCRWNLRTDTIHLCQRGSARILDVRSENVTWEVEASRADLPGVMHGNRGVFKPSGPFHPFAEDVLNFSMSDTGDPEKMKKLTRWPG